MVSGCCGPGGIGSGKRGRVVGNGGNGGKWWERSATPGRQKGIGGSGGRGPFDSFQISENDIAGHSISEALHDNFP